jgi:CheY-like chemotaxis protein
MSECAVLVVEDDQDSREAMMDVLRSESYEVEGAANALEALEMLRSGRFKPDVILVDLYMPAMDGNDFRLALRGDPRLQSIPVIVCTGDDTRSILGAFGTLQKPVDIDALSAVVRRGCHAGRGNRRAASA